MIHFYPEQKIENRVSTDEDLKLSDTLRYYMRDTTAAKNLLYRRLRCLADYEVFWFFTFLLIFFFLNWCNHQLVK